MAYPKVRWTSEGKSIDFSLEKESVIEIETGAETICVDREGKVVGFASDVLVHVWRNFESGKVILLKPDETLQLPAGIQFEMETGTAIVVRHLQGILAIGWAK